mgnify:CR=1 FL=1
MIVDIVKDYQKLCLHVTDLINLSGYRVDYVREKVGLSKPGFYAKRKKGFFTPDEMEKILGVIDSQELEDKALGIIMERDQKSGKLSADETREFFKNR